MESEEWMEHTAVLTEDDLNARWTISSGRIAARTRLFCFPPAGAGASMFARWRRCLAPEIDVCAIQPPGRENRRREAVVPDAEVVLGQLEKVICSKTDLPFAFFGHSLGGRLALDLAHRLQDRSRAMPSFVFLSGVRNPGLPFIDEPELHNLPDPVFDRYLEVLGEWPKEIFQQTAIRSRVCSLMRADLQLAASIAPLNSSRPLDCGLIVFCGDQDQVIDGKYASDWSSHSSQPVHIHLLKGKHLLTEEMQRTIIKQIGKALGFPVISATPDMTF